MLVRLTYPAYVRVIAAVHERLVGHELIIGVVVLDLTSRAEAMEQFLSNTIDNRCNDGGIPVLEHLHFWVFQSLHLEGFSLAGG